TPRYHNSARGLGPRRAGAARARPDPAAAADTRGRPRRALLPRMAHHAAPARLLSASQLVAPARERVLPAAQLDPDRRALEAQPLPERVLEIALVVIRDPLRLRPVDHDDRRIPAALMRIPQPDRAPADHRRGVRGRGLMQELRQPRSREIRAGRVEGRERRADQLRNAAAVQRREIMPAREADEIELAVDLGLHALALARGETVPLVDADHERPPPLDREADQVQILIRDALSSVEERDDDGGILDGLEALHDAELLDRLADTRPAADAGGIDQRETPAVPLARDHDAVASRAGLVGRHEPLRADQPVDQRRLADVRPPDDGEPRAFVRVDLVRFARFLVRRETRLDQRVDTVTLHRRDRERGAEAETEELRARERRIDALRLVHGTGDALARAPQALCDPLVLGGDAVAVIDDETHLVRLLERRVDLLLDQRLELAARAETARVDDEVRPPAEPRIAVAAIPREARIVRDQRVPRSGQAVEERRLADVRPADQRYGGEHRLRFRGERVRTLFLSLKGPMTPCQPRLPALRASTGASIPPGISPLPLRLLPRRR